MMKSRNVGFLLMPVCLLEYLTKIANDHTGLRRMETVELVPVGPIGPIGSCNPPTRGQDRNMNWEWKN